MTIAKKKRRPATSTGRLENFAEIHFVEKGEAAFWIRSLRIEEEIEGVRRMVEKDKEGVIAGVPVIAEYRLGPNLICIYCLSLTVDALGLSEGAGAVYFSSPEYEAEAYRRRDKLAEHILTSFRRSNKLKEMHLMEEKHE
jgi:hypothetical protein